MGVVFMGLLVLAFTVGAAGMLIGVALVEAGKGFVAVLVVSACSVIVWRLFAVIERVTGEQDEQKKQ